MTRIFIETRAGKRGQTNEERFIRHILNLIGKSNQVEIVCTDGYTNLEKYALELEKNSTIGGKNLVIFDADYPETNGGFAQRTAYLNTLKTNPCINFELFLYPNNQDDGIFEDLLELITTPQHASLLRCFTGYQDCVYKNNTANQYKLPIQKTKMYAYIDTMSKTKNDDDDFKKGNWFFEKSDYWNFDSPALNPLKDFLTTHI